MNPVSPEDVCKRGVLKYGDEIQQYINASNTTPKSHTLRTNSPLSTNYECTYENDDKGEIVVTRAHEI